MPKDLRECIVTNFFINVSFEALIILQFETIFINQNVCLQQLVVVAL